MFPSGVEEGVMFAVAPGLDIEARATGRSADRWFGEEALGVGLDGAGGEDGEDGEGLPKGASESTSTSGVVAGEAIAIYVSEAMATGLAGRSEGEAQKEGRGDNNESD